MPILTGDQRKVFFDNFGRHVTTMDEALAVLRADYPAALRCLALDPFAPLDPLDGDEAGEFSDAPEEHQSYFG